MVVWTIHSLGIDMQTASSIIILGLFSIINKPDSIQKICYSKCCFKEFSYSWEVAAFISMQKCALSERYITTACTALAVFWMLFHHGCVIWMLLHCSSAIWMLLHCSGVIWMQRSTIVVLFECCSTLAVLFEYCSTVALLFEYYLTIAVLFDCCSTVAVLFECCSTIAVLFEYCSIVAVLFERYSIVAVLFECCSTVAVLYECYSTVAVLFEYYSTMAELFEGYSAVAVLWILFHYCSVWHTTWWPLLQGRDGHSGSKGEAGLPVGTPSGFISMPQNFAKSVPALYLPLLSSVSHLQISELTRCIQFCWQ